MSRRAIYWALAPLLLLQFVLWYGFLPNNISGEGDFHAFYGAGKLIASGQASKLYDLGAMQLQPIPGAARPYIHLPYEALAFVPLSLLDYRTAYLIYLGLNLVMLGAALALILKARSSTDWPIVLAAAIGFIPLSTAFLRGQDAVAVLLLMAAAYCLLTKDRDFPAGLLVGIALFRFQLALPIAFLFLAWRNWKFIKGFALSAISVTGLSLALVGPAAFLDYWRQLLSMAGTHDQAWYEQFPSAMPNLRGLIESIMGGPSPILVLAASALVLALTALRKPTKPAGQLSLAVVAAALLGYHGYVPDMTILLLPLAVQILDIPIRPVAVVVLLSISALVLPQHWAFLGALPIFGLWMIMPGQLMSPRWRFAAHAEKTSSKSWSASTIP